jgi:hypothetical protein
VCDKDEIEKECDVVSQEQIVSTDETARGCDKDEIERECDVVSH